MGHRRVRVVRCVVAVVISMLAALVPSVAAAQEELTQKEKQTDGVDPGPRPASVFAEPTKEPVDAPPPPGGRTELRRPVKGERASPCSPSTGLVFPGPLREGRIYTPATDSFASVMPWGGATSRYVFHPGTPHPDAVEAGADGTPQFSGTAGVDEHVLVQAHWWNDWVNSVIWSNVQVFIENVDGVQAQYSFDAINNPGTFKCYAGENPSVHRGYFERWIPLPSHLSAEPGFNVRVEIKSFLNLRGADQNTVHIGPHPQTGHTPSPNDETLGLIVDDGALVDDNGVADDLESLLLPGIQQQVNSILPGIQGANLNFGGTSLSVSNVSGQLTSLDLSLAPAPAQTNWVTPPPFHATLSALGGLVGKHIAFHPGPVLDFSGSPDDDSHLRIAATLSNLSLSGVISNSPFSADYSVSGNLHIRLRVSLDAIINDTVPWANVIIESISITNTSASADIHQWFYDLITNENKIVNFIWNGLGGSSGLLAGLMNSAGVTSQIMGGVNNLIAPRVDQIRDTLAVGTPIGLEIGEFDHTCGRMGCNGALAGEILMSQQGLEVVVEAAATGGDGRFPKTYRTVTGGDVDDHMAMRISPGGMAFDAGLLVHGKLMNQALNALGGSGLLDLDAVPLAGALATVRPEVAPIFLPTTSGQGSSADRIRIVIPNLQVSLSSGADFAIDAVADVDLELGNGGALVPDVDLSFSATPMWCVNQTLCGILSDPGVNQALNQLLTDLVIQPLVDNSLGSFQLPQFGPIGITDLELSEVGGHVGLFAKLG